MRTSGTFLDVYRAAAATRDDDSGTPINPVIRREGETWTLESGLHPTDGDIEVSLEEFVGYWYEGIIDPDYRPSEQDIADWVGLIRQAQAEASLYPGVKP